MISTLTGGGAERAMSNITTHLPDGVEADLLLNSISEDDYDTDAHKISLNMPIVAKMNLRYQLRGTIRRFRTLRKLKKNGHYDACISFMDSANVCNILTGNKFCKTIISVRTSITNESNNSLEYRYIVSPLIRILYNKADYVVPLSQGVGRELIDDFHINKDKVVTITNGFDVTRIRQQELAPLPQVANMSPETFVYVTAGRYTTLKAQWHLIRAFAEIAKSHSEMRLLILGKGEERAYLQSLIDNLGMANRITLVPFSTNPFPYFHAADVYVMSSGWEGLCNALCEGLICGIPCISTDFQFGAREILAPDTDISYQNRTEIEYAKYGVITPVCSGTRYVGNEPLESAEELLAQAMLQMYESAELRERYHKAALERGEQMSIEEKVKEWLNLIDETIC